MRVIMIMIVVVRQGIVMVVAAHAVFHAKFAVLAAIAWHA